jgi:hypothetical protein
MERKYNINNLYKQIKNLKYEDYVLFINEKEWFDMKHLIETYFTPSEQIEFRKLKKTNPHQANLMTAGFVIRLHQDLTQKFKQVGAVVVNFKDKTPLILDLTPPQNTDNQSVNLS